MTWDAVLTSPIPFHRRQVEAMAGYGVPEVDIARVVGIDAKTLRMRSTAARSSPLPWKPLAEPNAPSSSPSSIASPETWPSSPG